MLATSFLDPWHSGKPLEVNPYNYGGKIVHDALFTFLKFCFHLVNTYSSCDL